MVFRFSGVSGEWAGHHDGTTSPSFRWPDDEAGEAAVERLLAELSGPDLDARDVAEALEACDAFARACVAYAFAVAAMPGAKVDACVEASLYCAEVCEAATGALSDPEEPAPLLIPALLRVCVEACRSWRGVCRCVPGPGRVRCVAACRRCERACVRLVVPADQRR